MAAIVKKRRWMPIVLGLSLAMNLAVIAAVSGAALRHNGSDKSRPRADKGGAIYMHALPRETRRELRQALRAHKPRAGSNPAEMLEVLRQDPFDPDAAARVLNAQHDASLQRLQTATGAWLTEVTAMSAQERSDYADRLQELVEKQEERGKEKGAPRD